MSGLMSALMDPGVDALAGFANSMAQAAMPTRMPTPFGAVVGMGAGGALQGARMSQQMQQAQQQVQAAKLQNQMTGMYLNALPGVVGAFGAPPPSGGTPAAMPGTASPTAAALAAGQPGSGAVAPVSQSSLGPPGAAPPRAGGQPPYLVAPQEMTQLGNLALLRGDPSAAATFYGQAQSMAGGPGYAMGANGTAFATPGGSKDPRVLATNASAVEYGKLRPDLAAKGWTVAQDGTLAPIPGGPADPAYQARQPYTLRPGGMRVDPYGIHKNAELEKVTNPDGTESYSWMEPPTSSANVPPQLTPGANPPPDPFPAWSARIDQVENSTGNPAATNPNSSAAGNGQFINSTWLTELQAVRPDLVQGKSPAELLALRSQPGLSQEVTTAYARQNAGVLANAGLPINAPNVYLSHFLGPQSAVKVLSTNPSTPLSMILPQATLAANPFLQGKNAGDAIIWAQGKMQGAAPAGAGNDGGAIPVMGPGGKPAVAELSGAATEAAKDFTTKDADTYGAAQNTQAWLEQIQHAANEMNKDGPLYMTGPNAAGRYALMSNINDGLRSMGLTPVFDQNAVANWEEMRKATINAGFELSSHYEGHARQAAATIENATAAVPGASNSPAGINLVIAGIREGAQANMDLYNYKAQVYKTKGAQALVGAEADFYKNNPAPLYADRAISSVHPYPITKPEQLNQYLPGTYVVLPVPKGSPGYDPRWNGKLAQVPERPGAPPIPSYLQQQAPQ